MTIKKTYSDKLKSPYWQKKRLEILQRDKWTCTCCKDTETELQVHHLKYNGNPWDVEEEFLITLCKHCHIYYEHFKDEGIVVNIKNPVFKNVYGENDFYLAVSHTEEKFKEHGDLFVLFDYYDNKVECSRIGKQALLKIIQVINSVLNQ